MEISSKSYIRTFILQIRKNYSFEVLKDLSFQICKQIEKISLYKKAKIIAFYFAKNKEVSLKYLIGKAFLENKKVFLPKTWIKEKT